MGTIDELVKKSTLKPFSKWNMKKKWPGRHLSPILPVSFILSLLLNILVDKLLILLSDGIRKRIY